MRKATIQDIYRVDRSAVERQLGHPIKTLAPWDEKCKACKGKGWVTGPRYRVKERRKYRVEDLEEMLRQLGLRMHLQIVPEELVTPPEKAAHSVTRRPGR